mmetsp:Transcript_17178/g.65569  ORF Transcript_17178/g.65569 Transcript_17178/m.65569 type:complete len:254 (-) Transcript_17178:222-983(-)|eukprot:scaffold53_cov193-Pinguiococcus_pyrenoidosus.AAC.50
MGGWDDPSFVAERVQRDGMELQFASEEVKGAKEVVLQAVARHGSSLYYAAAALKDDEDVVLAAVGQNGLSLCYASARLKAQKAVVDAAIANDGRAIYHADKSFHRDPLAVLAAVANRGDALQYAHWTLRQHYKILAVALKTDPRALLFVHPDLLVLNPENMVAQNLEKEVLQELVRKLWQSGNAAVLEKLIVIAAKWNAKETLQMFPATIIPSLRKMLVEEILPEDNSLFELLPAVCKKDPGLVKAANRVYGE